MKLYLISSPAYNVVDGPGPLPKGPECKWAGTQAAAAKIRRDYEAYFKELKPLKRPKVIVEEVEVPTKKDELIAWLNERTERVV